MPKALICHHSPYFRAALEGPFVEARNNTIELKEEDPECFESILAWLHVGSLAPYEPPDIPSQEHATARALEICHIYYLADFLRMTDLTTQLLGSLDDLMNFYRPHKIIALDQDLIFDIYEHTYNKSVLRLHIMDALARLFSDPEYDSAIDLFTDCFQSLEDFGPALARGSQKIVHQHKEEVRKAKTEAEETMTALQALMAQEAQTIWMINLQIGQVLGQAAVPRANQRPLLLRILAGPIGLIFDVLRSLVRIIDMQLDLLPAHLALIGRWAVKVAAYFKT